MATVTIRNLSDEVVEALKARAKRNHRSMEAEAREALTRLAADGDAPSGIEEDVARRLALQRWSTPWSVIEARLAADPGPDVDAEAWMADIRADGDVEDFRDPWAYAVERGHIKEGDA